jgi:UDP-glucose 4-epimerase
MIKALEKASGKTIAYQECPRRPGDLASVYADPALAAKELGWKAQRDLDDMCKSNIFIKKTIIKYKYIGRDLWRWQSNNPNGFQ